MSLYSNYLLERTADQIIENEDGFITYRFLNKNQVYIIDIYVLPDRRKSGLAGKLADQVIELAKARGCKEALGTVVASTKGSDDSIKILQSYGMKLFSHSNECIVFRKDI